MCGAATHEAVTTALLILAVVVVVLILALALALVLIVLVVTSFVVFIVLVLFVLRFLIFGRRLGARTIEGLVTVKHAFLLVTYLLSSEPSSGKPLLGEYGGESFPSS